MHDTTTSTRQQLAASTRKKDILGSLLIADCKRTPTFARQMWRHNYVVVHSEYLISTLS